MQGQMTGWIYSGYNSKQGFNFTTEINFDPGFLCIAQTELSYVSGGGLVEAGIAEIRFRDDPAGPETPISFPGWEHTVVQSNMTSVTFGTGVGAGQECYAVWNVFFW